MNAEDERFDSALRTSQAIADAVDPPVAEAVIQQAIEEWATIHSGPCPGGDPTLARYIAAKLREAGRG